MLAALMSPLSKRTDDPNLGLSPLPTFFRVRGRLNCVVTCPSHRVDTLHGHDIPKATVVGDYWAMLHRGSHDLLRRQVNCSVTADYRIQIATTWALCLCLCLCLCPSCDEMVEYGKYCTWVCNPLGTTLGELFNRLGGVQVASGH